MMFYKKEKITFKMNYQLILLLISICLSAYGIFKEEKAIYAMKQNPDFNVGETPVKICYYGINSIISGKAQSQYFSSRIFEYLKDNPTILHFNSDDKIIDVIYRDDKCKVITKNEEQIRGFILPLEKSMSFPLYYQVANVKEEDIVTIDTLSKKDRKKGE